MKARLRADIGKRTKAYTEAQQIIHEQRCGFRSVIRRPRCSRKSNVSGYRVSPFGTAEFHDGRGAVVTF